MEFSVSVHSRRSPDRTESEYTDKLQHYTSGRSKYHVVTSDADALFGSQVLFVVYFLFLFVYLLLSLSSFC